MYPTAKVLVVAMLIGRKIQKQSDWQFAMEQIGRELRKAYAPPENLPPRLAVLVTRLERQMPARRNRQRRDEED